MDDEAVRYLIRQVDQLHAFVAAWKSVSGQLLCDRQRREQILEEARQEFKFLVIAARNRPLEDYLHERRAVFTEAVAAEAYQRGVDPTPLAAAAVDWRRWFDADVQTAVVNLSARLATDGGSAGGNEPPKEPDDSSGRSDT